MTVAELEQIVEQVKTDFLNRIMNLSNAEVEVVLEGLIEYLDSSLAAVRAARGYQG